MVVLVFWRRIPESIVLNPPAEASSALRSQKLGIKDVVREDACVRCLCHRSIVGVLCDSKFCIEQIIVDNHKLSLEREGRERERDRESSIPKTILESGAPALCGPAAPFCPRQPLYPYLPTCLPPCVHA